MAVGNVTDKQFVEDLKRSDDDVWLVARWLSGLFKLHVMVAPLNIRPDVSQRFEYRDSGDLFLVNKSGDLDRIEVKRRSFHFTSQRDFPYESMIVGPVDQVDAMYPIPYAHIMLNGKGTSVCVIRALTQPHWRADLIYDTRYGRKSYVYKCPIEHCEFYDLV